VGLNRSAPEINTLVTNCKTSGGPASQPPLTSSTSERSEVTGDESSISSHINDFYLTKPIWSSFSYSDGGAQRRGLHYTLHGGSIAKLNTM